MMRKEIKCGLIKGKIVSNLNFMEDFHLEEQKDSQVICMPRGRIIIEYEFNTEDMSDLGYDLSQEPENLDNDGLSDVLTSIVSMLSDIDE